MRKWSNELNRHFSKEEVQMASKHGSTPLAKKQMQIKTTLRFKLSPARMATTTVNAGEDVQKKEPSYTVGGNYIPPTSTMESSVEMPQRCKNRSTN
jgi:hypothetical protein